MKTDIIICECFTPNHQIIISQDDDEIYFHIHLIKPKFWERVVKGLRYIFGMPVRYGHFDCFIINPDDYQKIIDILQQRIPVEGLFKNIRRDEELWNIAVATAGGDADRLFNHVMEMLSENTKKTLEANDKGFIKLYVARMLIWQHNDKHSTYNKKRQP